MWGYLKDPDAGRCNDYFTLNVPDALRAKYDVKPGRACIDTVQYMPEDDDTNYTTIGLAIMTKRGLDFTPLDVANFWMDNVPDPAHLHRRARGLSQPRRC